MAEVEGFSNGRDYHCFPLTEMKQILRRFEDRLNDAQMANAASKEWVTMAIHRHGAPRCPVRIKWLTPDIILKYGDDLAELLCEFPDDVICITPYDWSIGYQSVDQPNRINPIEASIQEAQWTDEWGTRWAHSSTGVGPAPVEFPIQDWSELDG